MGGLDGRGGKAMLDLLLRGDRVVTPQGVGAFDIGIAEERIVALASPGTLAPGESTRVIDVTGKIVMDNNKFVNGPNCGVTNSYLMMIESQTYADFKFEHNYVDGKAQQFPQSLIGLIVPFVQGKMVLKYNAFLNAPARPVISMDTHAQLFEYNYWEGFVYQIDDGHSEVVMNYLGNDKYQPSITYSFNTGLETNQACNCGAAMWYATGDGQNTSIGSVMVDHNTSIVNKTKDGEVTLSAASAETSYDTYGSVVFQQNYMDPTGSYECFISTSNPTYKTPPQFIDNVDILNGKTVTDYGNCPT